MNTINKTQLLFVLMALMMILSNCSKTSNQTNNEEQELATVKSHLANKTWYMCCTQYPDNTVTHEWPGDQAYYHFYGTDSIRNYAYDLGTNTVMYDFMMPSSIELVNGKVCLILSPFQYEILESSATHFAFTDTDYEWHYYTDYETSKYAYPF